MTAVLGACRAAAPEDGLPYHQERIRAGAPLPADRASTFTSTDGDLQGIEDSFRATLGFGGDPFAALGWSIDARTEEFDPATDVLHRAQARSLLDAPVPLGGLDDFRAELAALNMDPTLAALTGGVGIPSFSVPEVVDSIEMSGDLANTRVFWRPAAPAVTAATLHFDFPLSVRLGAVFPLNEIFDLGTWRTPVNVDIAATPCGTCGGTGCTDSGLRVNAGYRTAIADALGYSASEVDVIYPDQGLDFTTAVTGSPQISGRVTYSALCPFTIGTLPATVLAPLLPAPIAGELISLLQGALGSPFGYLVGLVACTIAAQELTQTIDPIILGVPPSLAGAIDLLVNPPMLSRSLASAGAVPGLAALPPLVRARATAGIALTGGGSFPGPLSNPDGSINDAFYSTVAAGGTATVTSVRLNLQPVIDGCATGIGLSASDVRDCGACAPGGACLGTPVCGFLCTPAGGFATTAQVPAAVLAFVPTITIAPAPRVAALLSGAPYFAETLRRWFANPLPAGARYIATAPSATARGSADFSYIVDPDGDCASSEGDACPGVFDPAQLETDGDAFGDACDLCQGLAASRPIDNGDADADGIGNACDCDIDGDGCLNAGFDLASGMACATPPAGVGYDDRPFSASAADWDGDGVPDACDLDQDNDGVADDVDNCPRGDGDDTFVAAVGGLLNDQDPDQSESGGLPLGDLCDPFCPGPGAPGCAAPAPRVFEIPREMAFFAPDLFPSGFECIYDGPRCGFAPAGICGPNDSGCLAGFTEIVGLDARGARAASFAALSLGIDAPITSLATVPDLDGDGVRDVALGAPEACVPGEQVCRDQGVVVILGTRTGAPISFLSQGGLGARFGAAIAVVGDSLAVGAPNAARGSGVRHGAVFLYRIGPGGSASLRRTIFGSAPGERFAEYVSAAPTEGGFLVGAPLADTTAIDAGRIDLVDESRGTRRSFAGSIGGGHLGRAVAVERPGGAVVVGAAPDSDGGAGALYFFEARHGHGRSVVRGAAGDRLGVSLVSVSTAAGAGAIAAGAPGRRGGEGAIDRFAATGSRVATTSVPGARSFGLRLTVPGDLDGDGADDVLVGLALADGRAATLAITSLPSRGR